MKKFSLIVVMFLLVGCASTKNTINRLQGDLPFFKEELKKYSSIVSEGKAKKVLESAEEMLSKAESAALIGDKIGKKKYLSALVDIMDLLPKKGN